MTTITYLLINVAVFAAAVLVTYLSKDPEPTFLAVRQRLLGRLERIAHLRGQLNQLTGELRHEVETIHESGHQAINYYRMVNRRKRHSVPDYFDNDEAKNHRVKFVEIELERFDDTDHGLTETTAEGFRSDGIALIPKPVVRMRGIR